MDDSDAPDPDSIEGPAQNADQFSLPRNSDGGDCARARLFWLVVGDDSASTSQKDQGEGEPHRLIARLRRLRADYLEAHRSGMAALDGHNFAGLRAAIEQEHDILKEQDHIINALRQPYSVKPEPQLSEASERAPVSVVLDASASSCPCCGKPGCPTLVKHQNWQKTITYHCGGCNQTWSFFFPDHEQQIHGMIAPSS